mmetsp:Transcript_23995/g.66721  ORF Transcript_23995/g.66721 Transcript_23995/m.66721 type:complete len:203 (+) Transcript_23995:132-740(+)
MLMGCTGNCLDHSNTCAALEIRSGKSGKNSHGHSSRSAGMACARSTAWIGHGTLSGTDAWNRPCGASSSARDTRWRRWRPPPRLLPRRLLTRWIVRQRHLGVWTQCRWRPCLSSKDPHCAHRSSLARWQVPLRALLSDAATPRPGPTKCANREASPPKLSSPWRPSALPAMPALQHFRRGLRKRRTPPTLQAILVSLVRLPS